MLSFLIKYSKIFQGECLIINLQQNHSMLEPYAKSILFNVVTPQLARITGVRNLRFRAVPSSTALPYQLTLRFSTNLGVILT